MEKFVLGDGDVVSTENAKFGMSSTFKKQELLNRLRNAASASNHEIHRNIYSWVDTNGVNCQVLLESGGGWKSGRVRVTLEFVPDEIDSPLTDLREKLNIE